MPPSQPTPRRPRVALATCAAHPELAPDDRLLIAALTARGVEPVPAVWDAPGIDWSEFDGCLVRSVWDYHLAPDRFLAWARHVATTVPIWNPPELIAWNADKHYLRELNRQGVSTIPTRWLQRGSEASLSEVLDEEGWKDAVLKPAVDLGARNLRRVRAGNGAGQRDLEKMLAVHDVMAQPFLPSLESRGELSLVHLAGAFSHSVRKLPAAGDFRVQPNWGGSSRAVEAGDAELEISHRALEQLPLAPLYARVDLVEGPDGELCLIELELIEPNLFLGERRGAAAALAAAVAAAVNAK